MLATTSTHDLLLIIAIVVFFVAAALRGWARSIDGTLVAVGLALFAWGMLVT